MSSSCSTQPMPPCLMRTMTLQSDSLLSAWLEFWCSSCMHEVCSFCNVVVAEAFNGPAQKYAQLEKEGREHSGACMMSITD